MIPFGGVYTRQEWGRGIRLAMHPRGRGLVLRWVGLILSLMAIGFFAVAIVRGEATAPRLLRAAASLGIFVYWALPPYIRAWQAARRPFRGPAAGPSLRGVISGEGISSNASSPPEIDKWDSFLRAHVREDLVVLLGSDGLATILPRSFFATEDDWNAFREFVEFNVVVPS
jgi:hypothetical protein